MRIGIYSGCFDPVHKGHEWIINEGSKIFDKLHVMIGPNPSKTHTFSEKERLEMLHCCTLRTNVKCGILPSYGILRYARRIDHGGDYAYLLRGIRDNKDFYYEQEICDAVRKLYPELQTVFFTPPEHLADLSSTHIKDVWQVQGVEAIKDMVPPYVHDYMKRWKGKIAFNPDSIFETTTAGFAPAPLEPWMYPPEKDPVAKIKANFDKLVNEGFIGFQKEITAKQVRTMIDEVPINVVSSEKFYLHCIPINDKVTPTGDRWLPASRSLGPIIVDLKTDELDDFDVYKQLAKVVIIEGKHRWLDAKDSGQPDIWAWVGEKALKELDLE